MRNKQSVGLALSGGGYKGLAHAGVLKFLEEQNIDIEVIAGTSAGSIVGCLYAFGKKPEEIRDIFLDVQLFSWNYISFKKAGLLDTEKFVEYLDNIFGNISLADLNKKVYISATDINSGRLKIFNKQTKVKEAVTASSAFPGVFSPILVEGRLYSDGGILNNFPVNTIQGRCDFLIGVNLDPSVHINNSPKNEKYDSIKSVALRAINIMMAQNTNPQNELCDWYISPQGLVDYTIFETSTKRMKEIYKIGYQEAERTFEKIKSNF